MSDYAKRAADAHVHASYFRKPEAIHPRGEEARNTAEVMALANERRDANKIAHDLTACRAELASIAILMQERDQLPDLGGVNYALVAGAVTTYVLAMELAVVALNEDRQQLLEQIGGLNNLLACDDDMATIGTQSARVAVATIAPRGRKILVPPPARGPMYHSSSYRSYR